VIKGEEKERQEREAARKKKEDFRRSLDQHMEVAHKIKAGDNTNDQGYANNIAKDIVQYNSDERAKFERIKQKNHEEAELRMQQIKEKAAKAAAEKQAAYDQDMRNQQMNMEKQREEQEKVARIRREKLENQERIKLENMENERLRALAKQAEAELDQRQMQEYAMKLDREAVEREHAFQHRMELMGKNGQKFATEGAGKAAKDMEIRTEQLLIKEQLRKEESDLAKELKKKEEQRRRTYLQLKENESQIEKKKREAAEQVPYKKPSLYSVELFCFTFLWLLFLAG
jgi:hypothetical protein